MIKEALNKIVSGGDLTMAEAKEVMREIMQGQATQAQIGAFLTALRMKGETANEIAGCAQAMRENAIEVKPKQDVLVDTCGTGGDGSGTFNISTTVAFVAVGAGLAVAKHGNRSVSSRCGSADLLQALGVNLELSAEQVARCIDEVGIGFLFAPLLHPAMKHALGPRKEIGLRTIFNILGPLCNPAQAKRQLLGVYDSNLTELMAEVLRALGTEHAFVVHGAHGLDELSITGPNKVSRLHDGHIETYYLDPQELGLRQANVSDLAGGTTEDNVAITKGVLKGEQGPRRDIVLLNAAAVIVAGGKAASFDDGLTLAAEAIDSGDAMRKLEQLVEFSQSIS
ncbi:MAG: anthranilate phosphoribosyltransferase [Dehalococcoidia bacterium]